MVKILYCIRHGTALHNDFFWTQLKEKAYRYFHDTPLTIKGIMEAELLGNEWKEINDIELIVTSPLMRTLCTTENIFYNRNIPVIVYDGIKEHPQSEEWCNLRSSKTILMERFPDYDFSDLKTENDTEWQRKKLPEEEEIVSHPSPDRHMSMCFTTIHQTSDQNTTYIKHIDCHKAQSLRRVFK